MTRGFIAAALAAVLAGALPARADFVLYDGSKNTTPDAQGWLYQTSPTSGSLATQSAGGGVTTLDTTARTSDLAGDFGLPPLVPVLNGATGFSVTLRAQLLSENHTRPDRAGFSLIVLGSDNRGVELGFWQNEVWAQNVGFTHGEGATFNTTAALTDYTVSILGNNYTLTADGSTLLTGSVRDYSASGPPYTFKNFIFFGDDTSSADAKVQVARVSVNPVPEPSSWALVGLGVLGLAARRWRR